MARRPIYLDHHATTPLDPRVLEAMDPYLRDDFGNAASRTHVYGWRAEAAVEDARERVAAALGARPKEVVFTSGATESNNLALLGAARARRSERDGIVTLATEHSAVLDPVEQLRREGLRTRLIGVAPDGLVDPSELEAALDDRTLLVSVMAANNEIGVLQPLDQIAAACQARGVLFHSDAAQAVGKLALRMDATPLDLLSISGHKLYGPKGVGALVVRTRRPRIKLQPLQFGGGHERGLRSGTLPVASIVGLARALEVCLEEMESEAARLRELRERLWKRLSTELEGVTLNGHPSRRLPGNLNLSFEAIDIDRLLLALPDLALSTGSACSSATPEPSHVLAAIGLPAAAARASLRFGLGRGTTIAEVESAADRVVQEVRAQRAAR